MKKAILTTSIILACCLSACSTKQATAPSESPVITTEANAEATPSETDTQETKFQIFDKDKDYSDLGYDMTRNNIYPFYLYGKNGWYYGTGWSKEDGSPCFQKLRSDGSDRTIIENEVIPIKIEEYEGYIYWINGNHQLHKALDSGDNPQQLFDKVTNFQIYDDSIYYEYDNGEFNQELWKCDLDGKNSELVIDEPAYYCYIYDDKVIYQGDTDSKNVETGEHLKIKDLDTDNTITLTTRHSYNPILDGENLYYLGSETREGANTLYKMNLTTFNETILKENVSEPIQLLDDYLYFSNPEDSNRLYKMDINGKNLQLVLQDKDAESIQVKSNGILYAIREYDSDGNALGVKHYYWADVDGGNPTELLDRSNWWLS